MKQKVNLREKLTLRLGTTLEYVAAGTALAGVIVGIVFTVNFLGNKKDAFAGSKSSSTITLSPENGDEGHHTREAQPTVTINNTQDSLFIQFSSDNDEPIQSAVLSLKDGNGEATTEQAVQARVLTSYDASKVNEKTSRVAIPAQGLPDKLEIKASAQIASSREAAPATTWSSSFIYNRHNSSIALIPQGTLMAQRKK